MIRQVYKAPCGKLILEVADGSVCSCLWKAADVGESTENASDHDFEVMDMVISQLDEYFGSRRNTFQLPLRIVGTPFRTKVWECLRAIPYGRTVTYGEIAWLCGCPGGQRAVAQACGHNPFAVLIPCHRVVASGGGLGGYTIVNSGKEKGSRPEGLAIKQYLLSHETGCCGIPAAAPSLAATSIDIVNI